MSGCRLRSFQSISSSSNYAINNSNHGGRSRPDHHVGSSGSGENIIEIVSLKVALGALNLTQFMFHQQMKRFATELLRVLKAQGGVKKHVRMDQFTAAFSQVFPSRQFYPEDYGLCYFTDLVYELIENSTLVALIKDEDGLSYLAIPKREQTAQEIHRTRIFATEVG